MPEAATFTPAYTTALDWSCPPSTTARANENQLIAAAQRGNLDAFNQLVLIYQDIVYRQAYWMMTEREAAEDATQEAFIRAYQNIHTVYGSTFKSWLLRITTNVCIDMLRRLKKRPTTSLEPTDEDGEEIESASWMATSGPSTEATIESREMMATVQDCLGRLQPEYRAAIILVDVQEMDYQAAARIMGICMGTFKSRLARARLQMRSQLTHSWGY
jgi:RNA polymerase sigma-70 factor (ECF subfamily)